MKGRRITGSASSWEDGKDRIDDTMKQHGFEKF
jgi:hypothetical protein